MFIRNVVSQLTEPSRINNETKCISQRLTEQNNTKMSRFAEQLNSKYKEVLKEPSANKIYNSSSRE